MLKDFSPFNFFSIFLAPFFWYRIAWLGLLIHPPPKPKLLLNLPVLLSMVVIYVLKSLPVILRLLKVCKRIFLFLRRRPVLYTCTWRARYDVQGFTPKVSSFYILNGIQFRYKILFPNEKYTVLFMLRDRGSGMHDVFKGITTRSIIILFLKGSPLPFSPGNKPFLTFIYSCPNTF